MNRFHSLRILLVAALGMLAMLALPSVSAARARGHHHARGHHLTAGRAHRSRRVLIRGANSSASGSPAGQENAGEVESFDGKTLTIKLFAGGTVSGTVTESTEIECSHQEGGDGQSSDGQEESENQSENQQSGDQNQQSGDQNQQSGDQNQQSGDEGDSADSEDQSSSSSSCGTAALVPGALVHEAELDLTPAGAVFQSVDLTS